MLYHRLPVRAAFAVLGVFALLALAYFTAPFPKAPETPAIVLSGGRVDTWWADTGLYRVEYRIQNVDQFDIRLQSASLKTDPQGAFAITGASFWTWGEQPAPATIGQDGSIALDGWKLAPREIATLRLSLRSADPAALQVWQTNPEASPLSSLEVRYRRFFRTWATRLITHP